MSDFRGRASLPCATCGLVDGTNSGHVHGTPVARPLTGKIVIVNWQKRALEVERKLEAIEMLHPSKYASDGKKLIWCMECDRAAPCNTRLVLDGKSVGPLELDT